jgi:hypothetical protein
MFSRYQMDTATHPPEDILMQTTTKPATKPATKRTSVAKPKTVTVASFVVAEITARLAKKGETYYTSALQYHAKRGTKFPRSDAHKAVTMEEAVKVFARHDNGTLASGSGIGQAVFDLYMLNRK